MNQTQHITNTEPNIQLTDYITNKFEQTTKLGDDKKLWLDYVNVLVPLINNTNVTKKSLEQQSNFIWDRYLFFRKNCELTSNITIKKKIFEFEEKANQEFVELELIVTDRPFIIDCIYNILADYGLYINEILHPIIGIVQQDAIWQSIEVATPTSNLKFSHVYCLVECTAEIDWDIFKQDFEASIKQLVYITEDFFAIKGKCEQFTKKNDIDNKEISESIIESEQHALFRWYLQGNLVFFGFSEIFESEINDKDLKLNPSLGLFRLMKDNKDSESLKIVHDNLRYFLKSSLNNSLIEINYKTYVHQLGYIVLALHKVHDQNFKAKIIVIACLFSKKSHHAYILNIPVVRLKLNAVLDRLKLLEGSHNYKSAVEYFGLFPRNELFRIDRSEMSFLFESIRYIWHLDQIKLISFSAQNQNYIRIIVLQPLEKMSTNQSLKIQRHLERTFDKKVNFLYSFNYNQLFHLHFVWFISREKIDKFDIKLTEQQLRQKLKPWSEKLIELIENNNLRKQLQPLLKIIDNGFSDEYKYSVNPSEALSDLLQFTKLIETSKTQIKINQINETTSKVNIYSYSNYPLRDIFLKFDSFIIEPIKSSISEINVDSKIIYLLSFKVNHPIIEIKDFQDFGQRITSILKLMLSNKVNNDRIFGLIAITKLNYKQIKLLQAYRNYLCLIVEKFNQQNINNCLIGNSNFVVGVVNYFQQKFNYKDNNQYENEVHLTKELNVLDKEILKTKTLLEESILKALASLVKTTLRTNYFINNHTISIKLDCEKIDILPEPKPKYEIFVFNEIIEGVHLRAGKISRGGLRISDRGDDYRTEILGLMQTQVLKNSVIVPDGAKGGFFVKKTWDNPNQARESLPNYYKCYIENLLQLTDNIVQNKVETPKNMVIYDKDDPYLVVAADKGTASYSDYANEISVKNNFWLGDAFASGGISGYNHKEYGITARGAFECLKAHLRELAVDINKDTFTLIGIGDMSGDVFGNGLLLSKKIKLIGAFNHRHIFIDPTPNPEISFEERTRLFQLPRSSWQDYDKLKISEGGGVFDRGAKTIELSNQIKELFNINKKAISGVEMIRILLGTEVDVIFNGGIGTYFKSIDETNAAVGDKVNEDVRVNTENIKAKIINEGGNLGVTQLGRIAFSLKGGLINTDAIDNSAGVDLSDHEVNTKILTNVMIEEGVLKNTEERQTLLNSVAEDLIKLCLNDNKLQSYRLSLDKRRSILESDYFISEIEHLEYIFNLDRKENSIPDNEWFMELRKNSIPIPRPILAELLSLCKNYVYDIILNSDIPDAKELDHYYLDYFPKKLTDKYNLLAMNHPLKREIISSMISNKFINSCGIIFLNTLHQITSSYVIDIIKAYLIVAELFPDNTLRDDLLQHSSASKFNHACDLVKELEELTKERVVWILANYEKQNLSFELIDLFKNTIEQYRSLPEDQKYAFSAKKINKRKKQLLNLGYNEQICQNFTEFVYLDNPIEASYLKNETGIDFNETNLLINGVEKYFNFNEIEKMLYETIGVDRWQKSFVGSLIIKVNNIKRKYFKVLSSYMKAYGAEDALDKFIESNKVEFEAYKTNWNLFYSSQSSKLEAISVLLDRLDNFAS